MSATIKYGCQARHSRISDDTGFEHGIAPMVSRNALVAAYVRDMQENQRLSVLVVSQLPLQGSRYRNAARHVDAAHAGQFTCGTVRFPADVPPSWDPFSWEPHRGSIYLWSTTVCGCWKNRGVVPKWRCWASGSSEVEAPKLPLQAGSCIESSEPPSSHLALWVDTGGVGSPKDPRRGLRGLPKRAPRMEISLLAGVGEGLTEHPELTLARRSAVPPRLHHRLARNQATTLI